MRVNHVLHWRYKLVMWNSMITQLVCNSSMCSYNESITDGDRDNDNCRGSQCISFGGWLSGQGHAHAKQTELSQY